MDIISTITLQLAEGFMIMVLLKLNYKLFLIWIDFLEQKEGYEDTLTTVNEDDLNGASLAFVRLQKTYHLQTMDLSKGEINGIKYRYQ